MGEKVERLEARVSSLFDAIKHGDDEHEKWLRKAIVDHFAGREVERPKGSGNREIIEQQQARISELEGETEHAARHLITKTEEGERWTVLWKDRAEATESALAQAEAREVVLVGLVNRLIENAEAFFQINEKDRCPWRVVRFDAPKILAATPDRIKATAEVLALVQKRGVYAHYEPEWEDAVRRLDQPESG